MKKIFLSLTLIGLIFPLFVLGGGGQMIIQIENPLKAQNFSEFLNSIINFLFWISLVLAPLMIIVGGFYFVISEGDTKKIETGKNIIRYTLIGFLIILLAKGLIKFLIDALTSSG